MKIIEIKFTELSKADYDSLSPDLKAECAALLRKLKQAGKKLGIPLESKNGKDLRGYYKLYFNQARHRVIYTVVDERIEITAIGETFRETIEIVGIGKRDKEFIYEMVQQRIIDREDNTDE